MHGQRAPARLIERDMLIARITDSMREHDDIIDAVRPGAAEATERAVLVNWRTPPIGRGRARWAPLNRAIQARSRFHWQRSATELSRSTARIPRFAFHRIRMICLAETSSSETIVVTLPDVRSTWNTLPGC